MHCSTCNMYMYMQVLDKGEVCEYGVPYELMCNPDSMLLKLVESTGPTSADELKSIAVAPYLIPVTQLQPAAQFSMFDFIGRYQLICLVWNYNHLKMSHDHAKAIPTLATRYYTYLLLQKTGLVFFEEIKHMYNFKVG